MLVLDIESWMGILQSLVVGHRHPLRTAFSETVMLAVFSSYIFTSLPSQMEMYPASENWPPLRRDWCASAGTIWKVRAASRRLCLRRATVVAGVGWPLTREKTLLDWSAVGPSPNYL